MRTFIDTIDQTSSVSASPLSYGPSRSSHPMKHQVGIRQVGENWLRSFFIQADTAIFFVRKHAAYIAKPEDPENNLSVAH